MKYNKGFAPLALVLVVMGIIAFGTNATAQNTTTVSTDNYSNVTDTSAKVSGTVLGYKDTSLHVYFEYGTAQSLGLSTTQTAVPPFTHAATLANLTPNTTYYYRFVGLPGMPCTPSIPAHCVPQIYYYGDVKSFTTAEVPKTPETTDSMKPAQTNSEIASDSDSSSSDVNLEVEAAPTEHTSVISRFFKAIRSFFASLFN